MANTIKCQNCQGVGVIEVLTSMHDDKTEYITCTVCKGKKVIHVMTDEEEKNYHDNYW